MTDELSRNDVRNFWRGKKDMIKAVHAAMDAGWRVLVSGGYPTLECPCEVRTRHRLPKSPGHGSSSAARKIRDKVAACPEKHRKGIG